MYLCILNFKKWSVPSIDLVSQEWPNLWSCTLHESFSSFSNFVTFNVTVYQEECTESLIQSRSDIYIYSRKHSFEPRFLFILITIYKKRVIPYSDRQINSKKYNASLISVSQINRHVQNHYRSKFNFRDKTLQHNI